MQNTGKFHFLHVFNCIWYLPPPPPEMIWQLVVMVVCTFGSLHLVVYPHPPEMSW